MKRHHLLPCLAVLTVASCHKASDPPSPPKTDYEAMAAAADARAEELAARAHLTESMTDQQILSAIGADAATFKPRTAPIESGGGTVQTSYTNETTQIEICRTPATGALLVYHMPWNEQQRWLVRGKAP